MFKRKCSRCGRKIQKDFEFCPYCGNDFRMQRKVERENDFGLLGRDDIITPNFNIKMPLGLDGLFNSLLKEVDKQFKELDKEMSKEQEKFNQAKQRNIGSGISISISSSGGNKPEIKVKRFGDFEQPKEMKIEKSEISDEEARRISQLPKKEAETKVRRLSNKIIYEIGLPGVKNLKDIIINKLESSIEIKAFSKEKVYFKLLPINLPILNYRLKDEKLLIELKPKS